VAAAACAQPCRKASGSGATPNDVLFRLATLGSAELEKRGFDRITYGSVHAPMPPMGFAVKTSDDLWKIIAFICSINPPGANPPEKVVPARMKQ